MYADLLLLLLPLDAAVRKGAKPKGGGRCA